MLKENFKIQWKQYKKSIIRQTVIKSAIVSMLALVSSEVVIWFTMPRLFWIGIAVSVIFFLAAFAIYYAIYRPTEKKFAKKLDELGLQQRVVTMNQYKDDDSLIARIQRQNAIDKVNELDSNALKATTKISLAVLLVIALLFGFGSITVNALTKSGVIANGKEVIEDVVPSLVSYYEVMYDIDGDGYIDGEEFQVVEEGEDCTMVSAVPEDNWYFVQWSDGVEEPSRTDKNICSNIYVTAQFAELDESDNSNGDEENDGEPQDSDREGEPRGGDSGDGDGGQPSDNSDQSGSRAGGKYEENNQVIDGETYYGDSTFDNAYDSAIEKLRDNGNMTDSEKGTVEDYFDTIQK